MRLGTLGKVSEKEGDGAMSVSQRQQRGHIFAFTRQKAPQSVGIIRRKIETVKVGSPAALRSLAPVCRISRCCCSSVRAGAAGAGAGALAVCALGQGFCLQARQNMRPAPPPQITAFDALFRNLIGRDSPHFGPQRRTTFELFLSHCSAYSRSAQLFDDQSKS